MSKDMEKEGLPSWLTAGTERFAPQAIDHHDEPVEIALGEAFERYLTVYFGRLQYAVDERGGRLSVTLEEFQRYIQTLIDSRVKHVRRYLGEPAPRVHYRTPAAVPTLVEKALSSIGKVDVPDVGITLIPTFTPTVELLTLSEFHDVTNKLRAVMANGFTYGAQAYDRNEGGAPDLMVMQFLQGAPDGVYSHRNASPAFATLAFFFGLRQMQSLLGARVFYADSVSLLHHLIELAAA